VIFYQPKPKKRFAKTRKFLQFIIILFAGFWMIFTYLKNLDDESSSKVLTGLNTAKNLLFNEISSLSETPKNKLLERCNNTSLDANEKSKKICEELRNNE
jgi:hypothetical protein